MHYRKVTMVYYDGNFLIRPLVTHFIECHFSTTIYHINFDGSFFTLNRQSLVFFCIKLMRNHFPTQVMKNLSKICESMLVL